MKRDMSPAFKLWLQSKFGYVGQSAVDTLSDKTYEKLLWDYLEERGTVTAG